MKSTHISRRRLLRNSLATAAAASLSRRLLANTLPQAASASPHRHIAPGPFEPT